MESSNPRQAGLSVPLTITWSHRGGDDCLRLDGDILRDTPGSWLTEVCRVYLRSVLGGTEPPPDLPPVAGEWSTTADGIEFVPHFPFVAGEEYVVFLEPPLVPIARSFSLARPATQRLCTTRVVEIYPTTNIIPVNQLKLYIAFSAPMSEGFGDRCIRIEGSKGPLHEPFHPMGPHELWDPKRRRLTVLFDPGRIKRGLVPNQEAGYPLVEGDDIAVLVDSAFMDARGSSLLEAATRRYRVGPEIRARVDPQAWRIERPAVRSQDDVVVHFDRPLDRALLEHCLSVRTSDGVKVPGRVAVGAFEQSWRFSPNLPWDPAWELEIDPMLEDLAGNSVRRVFDRDLERREDDPLDIERARVRIF